MSTTVLGAATPTIPFPRLENCVVPPLPVPRALARQQAVFSRRHLPDAPPEGDRWSTWDGAPHGPKPRPDWVVTDLGAVDAELGILKTGKEADVHLARAGGSRAPTACPDGRQALPHRRPPALPPRRRLPRGPRASGAAARCGRWPGAPDFGKEMIAAQWASAEFDALGRLWGMGLPVPYPVQLDGTEILMEFIGTDDGRAAPRLAAARPEPDLLAELFEQFRSRVARAGAARLGARRPVALQRPAPRGAAGPHRLAADRRRHRQPARARVPRARRATTMCTWFVGKGLEVDEGLLFGDLMGAATSRW